MIGLNRPLDTANGLKLLGERNSGTNVLEHLLQQVPDLKLYPSLPMLTWRDLRHFRRPISALWRYEAAREETLDDWHFRDLPTTGGWKHAAPTEAFQTQFLHRHSPAVLIIVRHPASWLRSMHRNPFHALTPIPRDFSRFLRQEWLCVSRDNLPRRALPNLPALYAAKVSAYTDLLAAYPNSALIRYEDLMRAPANTLAALGLSAPDGLSLPAEDPRAFAKAAQKKTYVADAAAAGYDLLATDDADFVRAALANTPAAAIYPD